MQWHFNEAHHGKGPMDGIGGTIKNVVYRNVKSGKILVNSAKASSVDYFIVPNGTHG